MITFRCSICKKEIKETIYIKIKSVSCNKCKKVMIKLFTPTKKYLREEMRLNKKFTTK